MKFLVIESFFQNCLKSGMKIRYIHKMEDITLSCKKKFNATFIDKKRVTLILL